jgi:hypothetical protein
MSALRDVTQGDLYRAMNEASSANGHTQPAPVYPRPAPRLPLTANGGGSYHNLDAAVKIARKVNAGTVLVAFAGALLFALAGAMGIVSWHAQYAFIYAIKHQELSATLEALGLDCGAVVFSVLGIALARIGRRAVIERALVCICAAGSCAMNAAGADLGSPRSVAAFIMPPVLFALTSDRLISVIRRSALGPKADAESQRSAWRLAGTAFLYVLRLIVAPPSTATGARRALLNATPLPQAPENGPAALQAQSPAPLAAIPAATKVAPKTRKSSADGAGRRLIAAAEHAADLTTIPLKNVSKLAGELAPAIPIHPGTARRVLLTHVRAVQGMTDTADQLAQDATS